MTSPPATVPDAVMVAAQRCRATLVGRLDGGGSGAVCLLGRARDGRLLVLKGVQHRPGVVDGWDLASFREKQRQQRLLSRLAPALARRYVPILDAVHDRTGSAYVLPYLPYPTLADLAATQPRRFGEVLRGVGRTLVEEGYAVGTRAAPAGWWRGMYTDRLPRRRWLLRRELPVEVLTARRVVVNGRPVLGLDEVHRAASGDPVDRLFAAGRLSVPVHGDLNLRNILLGPAATGPPDFLLIDPRGTRSPWDACYDLAKMLFTVTLFDEVMAAGLAVTATGPATYTVERLDPGRMRPALPAFLDALPNLRATLAAAGLADGHWRERLLFAHATHVLAESACRLSDRTVPRRARRDRSLGLLLLGLVLMTDLLERLGPGRRVDARAHLASIAAPARAAAERQPPGGG